ncbi:hypothetical protein NADFUDRAFT_4755, partial [Nadsonia fulvescens var. elongata DSM 6958]
LLLIYFSTYVIFAIIRVSTGISIKRLGYLSLRGVSYTSKKGIKVEIDKIGFSFQRSTVARPAWWSFYLSNIDIHVDPAKSLNSQSLNKNPSAKKNPESDTNETLDNNSEDANVTPAAKENSDDDSQEWSITPPKSKALTVIRFILSQARFLDFEIYSTTLNLQGVCKIILGQFAFKLHLRDFEPKKRAVIGTLDSYSHKAEIFPASFRILLQDLVLVTIVDDKEQKPDEFLDFASVEFNGVLAKEDLSLKDLSMNLRLGRFNILSDNVSNIITALKKLKKRSINSPEAAIDGNSEPRPSSFESKTDKTPTAPSPNDLEELYKFGTAFLRVFKDFQIFILRLNIHRIPASFLPPEIEGIDIVNTDSLTFTLSAKDLSLVIYRLNPNSPGFKLIFPPGEIAHQATFSTISFVLGLNSEDGLEEEVLYVPMITMSSRTNFFSKTLHFVKNSSVTSSTPISKPVKTDSENEMSTSNTNKPNDRNTTLLKANIQITSPTIDLRTYHVPKLFNAFSQPRTGSSSENHFSTSRYLSLFPKADIKITIEEPTARVLIPTGSSYDSIDQHRMVVSSCKTIMCELESSHSIYTTPAPTGTSLPPNSVSRYTLHSSLLINRNEIGYHSSEGTRNEILKVEQFSVKMSAFMFPTLKVAVHCNLDTINLLLTKNEVLKGLRELNIHLENARENLKNNKGVNESSDARKPVKVGHDEKKNQSFLRKLPSWLAHFKVEGSDIGISLGSTLADSPGDLLLTGITLKVNNWILDYRNKSINGNGKSLVRTGIDSSLNIPAGTTWSAEPGMQRKLPTDGRRLAISLAGVGAYKIFQSKKNHSPGASHAYGRDTDLVLFVPNFDLAFMSESDSTGPLLYVKIMIKKIIINYSIQAHFMTLIAMSLLKNTFSDKNKTSNSFTSSSTDIETSETKKTNKEFTSIKVLVDIIRIKCIFPNPKVKMLLEFNGLAVANYRSSDWKINVTYIRAFCVSPIIENAWCRFLTFRGICTEYSNTSATDSSTDTTTNVEDNKSISLDFDALRMSIPYKYVFYSLADQVVSTFKTALNLSRRYETNSSDVVIHPVAKEAKKLPKIRLRSPSFIMAVNDDPFEDQLRLIFEIGKQAQKDRMAKEMVYDLKVQAILEEKLKLKKAQRTNTNGTDDPTSEIKVPSKKTRTGSNLLAFAKKKHDKKSNLENSDSKQILEPQVSIEKAYERLLYNFSTSWIRTFRLAQLRDRERFVSKMNELWGIDDVHIDTLENEKIVNFDYTVPLMCLYMKNIDFVIDAPRYEGNDIKKFMYDIGKGQPYNSEYSILFPMYLNLNMDELRVQLRDYPLPFLHFPPRHHSQTSDISALTIRGNMVVGEDLVKGVQSLRQVLVPLLPLARLSTEKIPGPFLVKIFRTISPVKFYSDLEFIATSLSPTRFQYSTSTQPAIQAVMQVLETFSKPPLDPSERIGFWDKLRLIFHSRMKFTWTDGDAQLLLKGSRDPHALLGSAAGFVMCWRNNVTLRINPDDNPKEFITVTSDDYLLAIPNYALQEKEYLLSSSFDTHRYMSNSNPNVGFQKIIMKLSGRVSWVAGILFERDANVQGERTTKSKHHYDIELCHPDYVKNHENYDAYKGFRSHYIHLAMSLTSIGNKAWSEKIVIDENSYNTIHLTPQSFHYFLKWWSLFDSALSLPVKRGNLFFPKEKPAKKFGRHLFTIKYKLLLSPLFICHVHRHPSSDDLTNNNRVATSGIKCKVDNFVMDLHQRREKNVSEKRWKMKMNRGEIDFASADIRMVSALFKDSSPQELFARKLNLENVSPSSSISNGTSDISSLIASSVGSAINGSTNKVFAKVKINDQDYRWIDFDDFVELDEVGLSMSAPQVSIHPLCFTPRWTYFRNTDNKASKRSSEPDTENYFKPFGDEPSHDCHMALSHPERTQKLLFEGRLQEIDEQIQTHKDMLGSLKQNLSQFPQGHDAVAKRIKEVESILRQLKERAQVIMRILSYPDIDKDDYDKAGCAGESPTGSDTGSESVYSDFNFEMREISDLQSTFSNTFIVHNVLFKWNNTVRNALYRYIHSIGNRRKLDYFMSRGAIRYIEEIIEQISERNEYQKSGTEKAYSNADEFSLNSNNKEAVKNIFHQIIDESETSASRMKTFESDLHKVVENTHDAEDTYIVRLISPQIQLVSDYNPDSCVLLTAPNIELKIISIIDSDEVSYSMESLVETRYGVLLQDAHFFVMNKSSFEECQSVVLNNNSYGCSKNTQWPPWLAVECCFVSKPLKFASVIERTSACLRYDKPNLLRIKNGTKCEASSSGEETKSKCTSSVVRNEEHRPNRISVDFPRVVATCTSSQYFSVYTIAVDLLMYSEPHQKKVTDELEKLMLTTDFTKLDGASSRISQLQEEIHQLMAIRREHHIRNDERNDKTRTFELEAIDLELYSARFQLLTTMNAIRTGIKTQSNRGDALLDVAKWAIDSDQIIWHVLLDNRKPFLDVGLANASFNRLEGSDRSNSNMIEIGMVQAFHLEPGTLYPELLSPYSDDSTIECKPGQKFLNVEWSMLAPIGGITIMEHFELNFLPVKLELDHETGRKIFSYIFPSNAETGDVKESPFIVNDFKTEIDKIDDDTSSASNNSASNLLLRRSAVSSSITPSANGNKNNPRHYKPSSTGPGAAIVSGSSNNSTVPSQTKRDRQESKRKRWKDSETDDATLMVKRASNYLSIINIRIPEVILCISYKGPGRRNIADVQSFVFTIPTLEYRNKTWSILDLANHLKKDVMKALLRHTGALINNKLTRHRKTRLSHPLKQMSNYVSFTKVSDL